MTKSNTARTPDKLAKTGKKAGVELTEVQLGQAAGGAPPLDPYRLKIKM
jgi:hypothetical protein